MNVVKPAPVTISRVRCPGAGCRQVLELPTERLGRSMRCPACGVRMTARPLGIDERLQAQERRIAGGTGLAIARLPFAVLVDNVRSLWNVGSIFRTADACGVRELVLSGITGCPPRDEISKTALGAEQAVSWRYRAEPLAALRELVEQGYAPVALEASGRALPVEQLDWPARVCLVIGNEVAGVSPELLERCPHHARIAMLGVKESLNVAVAFGIAAYHAARALGGSRP